MAGKPGDTTAKSNTASLIAVMALGLTLVSGGVLLRRQQDQVRLAAIAATQGGPPAETVPLVDAEVVLIPSEDETGAAPPTGTPLPELAANPLADVTAAPTATPIPAHTLAVKETYAPPSEVPPTAIPTAADPIEVPDGVVNILLLGSDLRQDPNDPGYRTDTIIIVSVNRKEGTVSLLSFPRDLYVYIPGWTMNRINTADSRGSAVGWEGGGPGLLRETLLYNFGIQTHYYARVGFDGFKTIVDTLGGIDIPVDCPVTSYRLKDPSVTADDFATWDQWAEYTGNDDNFELYTLDVGVHHLDGYMALWYARARTGSSDYDRSRRQQQVLRAIWNNSTQLGWLEPGPESVARISSLWVTGNEIVETDMGLGNVLQLAPIAANLDTSRIRSYFIGPDETRGWITPDEKQAVLLPVPKEVERIATLALQPPAANYAAANTATVEVRNGTTLDRLDEVAADRLGWENLIAIPTGPADRDDYEQTLIFDFTGTSKGSQLYTLQRLMAVPLDRVTTQPDPNRSVDYLIILGEDYTKRTCSP